MRRRWGEAAQTSWHRVRCYRFLTLFLFLLALLVTSFKDKFNFVVSDGRGYYVYLPSLVIDGDLDFSNQIREHWDKDFHPARLEDLTPKGYVRNRYTIAFAMTLAPAFLLSHSASIVLSAISGAKIFAPDGYTILYQLLCSAFIMSLGYGILVRVDRILAERLKLPPPAVLGGVLFASLGSPFLYYWFREPFMVHVLSSFWVTCALWSIHRLSSDRSESKSKKSFILQLCGFFGALGMAVLMRPTNIFLAPFAIYAACLAFQRKARISLVLASLITLLPVLPQLWVWHRMSGHWFYYSYGSEGFDWLHPALWSSLFSSRHGLFFWSPTLALSSLGYVLSLKEGVMRDPFLLCAFLASLILWYLNSAWSDWWFGDAFGGRAYTELICFFAIGLGLLLTRSMGMRGGRRLLIPLLLVASLLFQASLMLAYIAHVVPRDASIF